MRWRDATRDGSEFDAYARGPYTAAPCSPSWLRWVSVSRMRRPRKRRRNPACPARSGRRASASSGYRTGPPVLRGSVKVAAAFHPHRAARRIVPARCVATMAVAAVAVRVTLPFFGGLSTVTLAPGAVVTGKTPHNCEPDIGTCTEPTSQNRSTLASQAAVEGGRQFQSTCGYLREPVSTLFPVLLR